MLHVGSAGSAGYARRPWPQPSAAKEASGDEQTNVPAATRHYLDGLNALDVDQVVGSFAPDATIRYPGLGTTSPEGFRQYLS